MKKIISSIVLIISFFLMCLSSSASTISVNPKISRPPSFSEEASLLRFGDHIKLKDNITINPSSIDALLMINGTFEQNIFPIIENGRSLVPIRVISEKFSFKVDWVSSENKIIITNKDKMIELFIGIKTAKIGDSYFELEVSPKIINGRTYVPLRFVSEALGMNIGYEYDIIDFPIVWVSDNIDDSKIDITEQDALIAIQKEIKDLALSQNMLDNYNDVVSEFKFENSGESYGRFWLITAKYGHDFNTKYFLVDKETKQMFVANSFGISDGVSLFNYFIAG